MRIFVTRPEPGLSETMKKLVYLGKKPIACPMLHVTQEAALKPMDGNTILITSRHSLSALENQDRYCRILAVGEKTAEKAREMGFLNVFAADGDAEKLVELYHRLNGVPADSWLAAGCGNDGKLYGDYLVNALGIRRFLTYRVRWATSFSEEVRAVLRSETLKQVLFYSSETARAFCHLLMLEEQSSGQKIDRTCMEAFCFSEAIAKALKESAPDKKWARIENNLKAIFD